MKKLIAYTVIASILASYVPPATAIAPPDQSVGDMPVLHEPFFRTGTPVISTTTYRDYGSAITQANIPFVDEFGRAWRMALDFNRDTYTLFVSSPEVGNNALITTGVMNAVQRELLYQAALEVRRRKLDPSQPPVIDTQGWLEIVALIIAAAGLGLALEGAISRYNAQAAERARADIECNNNASRDWLTALAQAQEQCELRPHANDRGQICSYRPHVVDNQPDRCAGPVYNSTMCVKECI